MGTHVLGIDGGLLALDVLPQEGADLQRGRAAAGEIGHEVLEGEAGVEDVLDDQDVAVLDVDVEVLDDADGAGGLGAVAVAGHGHEVDGQIGVDGAHQVAHEHDGTAQDGDEDQVLTLVILGDLSAQALDHIRNVLLGEQDLLDIRMHRFHDFPFTCMYKMVEAYPHSGTLHVANGTNR